MDFTLDDELVAVRDLTNEILTDRATPERARAVEESESGMDEQLWRELADAGLFGLTLPEEFDGAGLTFGAMCVLLEELGRFVAPVPVWASSVAALAIATYGTPEQRMAVLPGTVDGSCRLTVAVEEFGPVNPRRPAVVARPDGDGWRLTGTKAVVPAPVGADYVVASAMTESGPGLFLLDATANGVRVESAQTTSREPAGHLDLDAAYASAVGAPGAGAVEWMVEHASVALAALQLGVAHGALSLAATHLSERTQFGRPLATFQAVQHQLADCYIDIDAMRVTVWQAVSALTDGAGASRAVLVANWWAAQAGLDVVHRVQHVHGGIGVDVDYPVHRFFLWSKQLSATLGGAAATLEELGEVLAGEEVAS